MNAPVLEAERARDAPFVERVGVIARAERARENAFEKSGIERHERRPFAGAQRNSASARRAPVASIVASTAIPTTE